MTSPSSHDQQEPDNGDLLPLLLKICEQFFAETDPVTRDGLDRLLHAHGITGGPGWLIDMLALVRLAGCGRTACNTELLTPSNT
jgi:hypothetical protein